MTTNILVLCTGNSARSQMAEGVLLSLDPRLAVSSAGTRPAARVHPAAVQAMAEIGVDIRSARPKHVDEFAGQAFDYVITVCDHANETCPVFPAAATRLHISFRDPAAVTGSEEDVLEAFREVRDEIRARFGKLYREQIRKPREPEPARPFGR